MTIIEKIRIRLFRGFTYLRRDIQGMLGMNEHFYKAARGSRIIIYHGICQNDHTRFNTIFIRKKTFEKHLQFYKKYFNVVSLADFYKGQFKNDRFNICITFDDGFANNYKYVLPLLEKYKVPAVFFVTAVRDEGHNILWNDYLTIASAKGPRKIMFRDESYYKHRGKYVSATTHTTLAEMLRNTGFEEKKEMMKILAPYAPGKQSKKLEDYWLQMTVNEIKQAAASPYITIGSHGYYHNDLARISINEMTEELKKSKNFLEQTTGKLVTAVAFPYGSYSPVVMEESVKAGYKQLLATEFLHINDHNNLLMKERMGVNPFIRLHAQMYAIIKGKYA